MLIKNVNVINHDYSFLADVTIENGKFVKIKKTSNEIDPKANCIFPGFIDSHTHGGYGWDFNSLAKNDLKHASDYLNKIGSEGVTTVIGTTVTCSKKDLESISKNWKNFLKLDKNKIIAGWYIEGPFISKEKKGAHEEKLIIPVDTKLLNNIHKENKFIKLVAIAPEIKNNLSLIKEISKKYIVCIGHSNCDADTALASMVNGATRIIHLYNQTSKFDHRNPGIVNMAFLDTPMYCELICDGFHVDKLVLKNTYDIIGTNRIIAITDSLSCKGLKNGKYTLGGLPIIKNDEIARLCDGGNIAGSVKPFNKQMNTFISSTGCSMNDIVKIASFNPAKSIGLADKIGIIKENYFADFFITDSKNNIIETYKNGKLIFRR